MSLKTIVGKFLCLIGDHDWTCDAERGMPPTKEQVELGIKGFWLYAKMYCKRCKKVYHGSS